MQTITTIGLDIAKSVFQVHGVDAGGQVIVRRQLKRRYVLTFFHKLSPCLIGIEACGSSHHWVGYSYGVPHCFEIGMKSCFWSGFCNRASIQSLIRAYVAPFWPYGFKPQCSSLGLL